MNVISDINKETQATIETERMSLRPIRVSDAGLVALYARDIRVSGPTRSIPHPLPPGATEGFIENCQKSDRDEDVWVLDGTTSGLPEVLGLVSLERIGRNQSKLGYWLAPSFWSMGFAREAVTSLLVANPHSAKMVFAEVFQDTPRSAKVLTDLGFLYLGDAESWCMARSKSVATWTYSKEMNCTK